MGPVLQLFGCTDISQPFDPNSKAWQDEFVENISDSNAMPLVPPIDIEKAAELYPGSIYLEANAQYFESQEPLVDFVTGTIQTRDNIDFQEYILTHGTTTAQPVYALATGYLYYLTGGQSVSYLLGGTHVKTGETILVLLPIPTTIKSWKDKQPAKQFLPDQCAYLETDIISVTCSSATDLSEPCLKKLVKKTATRKYYEKIYAQYDTSGNNLPATDWEDDFIRLFKENPEVPLIVQGGSQIGWTKAVSETTSTQSVKMFFSFNNSWNSSVDDTTRPFFIYHQRNSGLAGHPLIAKLLHQTVKAGTVDFLIPVGVTGGRSKSTLTKEFKEMQSNGIRTHHPLAIDPDQHPARLTVPIIPDPFPQTPNLSLREDQKLTYLKISNPLGLIITIEDAPSAINISPLVFQEKEQVVEIKLVGELPSILSYEITIRFLAQDPLGFSSEAFKVVLTFMDFHTIPILFYQLFNLNHLTDINEQKLLDVISYANDILGRQTNVYIYPVEDEATILLPFDYTDGDLGDPIPEGGVANLWQQMREFVVPHNIRVLFVWDAEAGGDAVGATYSPPQAPDPTNPTNPTINWWEIITIDTKKQGQFDASVFYTAMVLVHELGHWFSTRFIYWDSVIMTTCANGGEHFFHNDCPGGDWSLNGNVMATNVGQDNIWLTNDQRVVYNTYAKDVLP